MKAALTILIVIATFGLIHWVMGGEPMGHPAGLLPLLGRHHPGIYDVGGLALLAIMAWGIHRLKHPYSTLDPIENDRDPEDEIQAQDENEEVDEDQPEDRDDEQEDDD